MRSISFSKGHGTLNDFVIVEDRSNLEPLSDDDVRFLCDRRAGVGADGLLRVTRAKNIPGWTGPDLWFMDYRNADGSIAEMCGNGLRVFGRYLYDQGLLAREPAEVGTRAGVRWIEPRAEGGLSVTIGAVTISDEQVSISTVDGTWPAVKVDVGNPHAVVLLPPATDLSALDLRHAPRWSPADAYPRGVNVEFVVPTGSDEVAMRVFERGSGETMSCGTGTVAAAAAYAHSTGRGDGIFSVTVPGGRVDVELALGEAVLSGPAVIVASGRVHLPS